MSARFVTNKPSCIVLFLNHSRSAFVWSSDAYILKHVNRIRQGLNEKIVEFSFFLLNPSLSLFKEKMHWWLLFKDRSELITFDLLYPNAFEEKINVHQTYHVTNNQI